MSHKKIKRILLKLSGEALMGDDSYGIKLSIVDRIASDIKALSKKKIDICIVLGGGNIFRGLSASSEGMDRAQADYMGMLATVLNSLALQNALEKINIDTRVMSALPIQSICETYIRRRAIRHMEKGRVVICAAGTGNPYFSTDTAAALRAAELECNVIYKATQVDGIYDKDPKKFINAKKYKNISYKKFLNDNLKAMDSSAITVAQDNNIPIIVFSIAEKNCLIKTLSEKNKYTRIS
ncbi:MAG: UMP kinase [Candidatus Pelagibacterales bacterium]|jgi:uridylate kinase|tara:strand:- start:11872 stop:12585 length:714 start_codon:yes stop_codon:yes gene_type:complete